MKYGLRILNEEKKVLQIVVDAMGGDHAPSAVIKGVVDAVNEIGADIALIGLSDIIEQELSQLKYNKNKIEIIHAPEVIQMDEPATVGIRKKRNSSIVRGIELLKGDKYKAFISAGNTGAVVATATINLRMIPGVDRPAIGLVLPTLKGFTFIIDVGANTDPKPEHLLQSSLMANFYAREVLGIENPSVGLLNIGEEASKGPDFVKGTYKMMAEKLPNFIGNIEANDIYTGECDCIVTDGFVGNVIIKISQSLSESAAALIRREIKKSPIALFGAFLMKSRLHHIKNLADYSEYGGAPLLGVNGIVMISHGRSDAKAIKNAIKATKKEIENNILDKLIKEMSNGL